MKGVQSNTRTHVMDALTTGYRIVPDDDASFKVERHIDPHLVLQLALLLAWQKAVNPITEPLPPERYVEHPEARPSSKLKRMPTIFPLFRLFPTPSRPFGGRIPSAQEVDRAWLALMTEVERRWNTLFPDDRIEIANRDASGRPKSCIYHAHRPKADDRVLFHTDNGSYAVRQSWAFGDRMEDWHLAESGED
jgi:hypothetical protein